MLHAMMVKGVCVSIVLSSTKIDVIGGVSCLTRWLLVIVGNGNGLIVRGLYPSTCVFT